MYISTTCVSTYEPHAYLDTHVVDMYIFKLNGCNVHVMHTCIQIDTHHVCVHTCTHTRTHSHACVHACMHAYTHPSSTHALSRTHTHVTQIMFSTYVDMTHAHTHMWYRYGACVWYVHIQNTWLYLMCPHMRVHVRLQTMRIACRACASPYMSR